MGRASEFGRDVRPLLARHCFKCHGPDSDAREADLRLDQEKAAKEDRGGYAAIVGGNASASEIVKRIRSDDPDLQMPPPGSGNALTEKDVAILSEWIDAGGHYEKHWAFDPPASVTIPDCNSQWCRNPIDQFVLHRLERAGLDQAPMADREQLIRRLSIDLLGTLPAPAEVRRFLADEKPDAYEKLVDRLLASPDYAERFARPWLDLSRYSDTNGYEKDRNRTIWPYRDWVISAIGADMPFDQFSIEQLAGDMLPQATNQQKIATGFHRNTMLNEEGGIDPQEYRYHSIVDRVATTGTVWMGLTTGCAQCHTHKYDPITHDDYFGLFALLNNADEPDVIVANARREQLTAELQRQITLAQHEIINSLLPSHGEFLEFHRDHVNSGPKSGENKTNDKKSLVAGFYDWVRNRVMETRKWMVLEPVKMASTKPDLEVLPDLSIRASGDVTKREVYRLTFPLPAVDMPVTGLRLDVLPDESLPAGGPGLAFYEGRRGDFFLSELTCKIDGQSVKLENASHSYGKISVGSGNADASNVIDGEGSTGWSTSGAEGKANQWVVNFAEKGKAGKHLEIELTFERHFAAGLGRFRFAITADSSPVVASTLPQSMYGWHVSDVSEISQEDFGTLQRHFLDTAPQLKAQRKRIKALEAKIPAVVRTLGMRERDPSNQRITHRHHRGEYLQPREIVVAGLPEFLTGESTIEPADRLSFARWLVSAENPLVARVTVNRAWREFFGRGLVDTAGDFGTQSEPPSHPDLLDWLALDLISHGWSLKRLHRLIVLSATYRQVVRNPNPKDPDNRLLSGMPRRRLSAEQIRDSFLDASGLLVRRSGGPSVFPPQPDGVMQLAYGAPKWQTSLGANRYRRSIYTFSKRTAPFAAFATFGGPSGETCLARRERSTTPLQALSLLNDEMYLEYAVGMADTVIRQLGNDASPREVAIAMFRRLLCRNPNARELSMILTFYDRQKMNPQVWMLVARALMNTDEAISTP